MALIWDYDEPTSGNLNNQLKFNYNKKSVKVTKL